MDPAREKSTKKKAGGDEGAGEGGGKVGDASGETPETVDLEAAPQLLFTTPSLGPKNRQPTTPTTGTEPGVESPALAIDGPAEPQHSHEHEHHSQSHHSQPLHVSASKLHRRRLSRVASRLPKHIRLQPPHLGTGTGTGSGPKSPASSIYRGSYAHSPRHSRSRSSLGNGSSAPPSPRPSTRASLSHSQLEGLLQGLDLDLETYGVEEFRDGFFDGAFLKPPKVDHEDMMRDAECTLPEAFRKKNPLSPLNFFPKQWHGIKGVLKAVTTTRAGIKLTKSFLAFFIAYILCLVPSVRNWLGRYSYIMVLSALINHPGRTVGAQLDGAFLTILGTATGLGWGAFALYLSDSTSVAQRGYGGILAAFLVIFMAVIAALRSYFIRLYQFVLAAGIAIIYTVLADTSRSVSWGKLFDYGIPWLLGQALCFIICCAVFPDAGARPLAVALHNAFAVMEAGLVLPEPDPINTHRNLAWTFGNLSQAHRDLVLDVSITRFKPKDVMSLRNLMQGVIRSLLALKMKTHLLEVFEEKDLENEKKLGTTPEDKSNPVVGVPPPNVPGAAIINIDNEKAPPLCRTHTEERAVKLVVNKLADPTRKLLTCIRNALKTCDAVLMDMSSYRKYLGPSKDVSNDVVGALTKLRKVSIKYDQEEESLLQNPSLPPTYSNHPGVIELFLFVHPIRQAATSTEALIVKVMQMQQEHRGWRLYLPSYPWKKALQRTNAQVRHDRGGVTAGFYFRSQTQLAHTMRGMANVYKPAPRPPKDGVPSSQDPAQEIIRTETIGKYEEEEDVAMSRTSKATKSQRFRYKLWVVLHRLQGFESRFALKVVITTALLAVPAWLEQSRGWWNEDESWWAVVMVWVMSHPRVGGNIQDLVTRAFCGVLGAVWGGLAYFSHNGNPYIMGLFAFLYMVPMIYRFTQSPHPRSGIVGCISFTIVSLSAQTTNGLPSPLQISYTRGFAFVIGVVAAVVVNWILWPFVARHELRKALSAMLIYESIIYRGVVAKYVYFEKGEEPGREDIERSEMLEGRLREAFVRIRQLMALTRHEIRLRAPFDPLPYSALIASCEHFFEYLISVRQSSLFFHPHFMSDNEVAAESLLSYRRDAVAAILMNLYVLAGALRGGGGVPKYLPSPSLARKRLLDHMALLELEHQSPSSSTKAEKTTTGDTVGDSRKWAQVYSYSYSQSLTGCVKELEMLQRWTREICGEVDFDFKGDGEEK